MTAISSILPNSERAKGPPSPEPGPPGSCCSAPPAVRVPLKPGVQILSGIAGSEVQHAFHQTTLNIPGGRAEIGTDAPYIDADGEGPRRTIKLKPFRLGLTSVTNSQFATFIEATGYVTEAEQFGWSYVFYQHVQGADETAGVVGAEWWRRVDGAYWRVPFGPGSTLEGRDEYPAVHVSWNDAMAFAAWAGGRLPTEAEWEHAARGGLERPIYPWGNRHPNDKDFTPCNIWQGSFPDHNTAIDGFAGLAPARMFEPNGYGLYNMSGNCWEWTAENFRVRSLKAVAKAANERAKQTGLKLLKGGSHLCHSSYCHRYRIAARTGNTPDSTTGHIGFRLAFDT